jgi:hypothetical protein
MPGRTEKFSTIDVTPTLDELYKLSIALVAVASVLNTSSATVCVGGGPSSTNFLHDEKKLPVKRMIIKNLLIEVLLKVVMKSLF